MIAVLLTILKVLGWLLLTVLFVLLLLLLVPFRYELSGEKYEELRFSGGFSWLFRFISVRFFYEKKKFSLVPSVCGKQIGTGKKEKAGEAEAPPEENAAEEAVEEEESGKKKKKLPDGFLTDERTRYAFMRALTAVLKMLKHILPRSLTGEILFGAEEPDTTGRILAVLSGTYPLHKNAVRITPDFSRKVLEGYISMKGRVILIVLLVLVLRALIDKNVRYVIKQLRAQKKMTEVQNG